MGVDLIVDNYQNAPNHDNNASLNVNPYPMRFNGYHKMANVNVFMKNDAF